MEYKSCNNEFCWNFFEVKCVFGFQMRGKGRTFLGNDNFFVKKNAISGFFVLFGVDS